MQLEKFRAGQAQADHVRRYYMARIAAPAASYRRAFAETLTYRRELSINHRPIFDNVRGVLAEGIGEIARLRYEELCIPLHHTLDRIKLSVNEIEKLSAPADRDFWAPRR